MTFWLIAAGAALILAFFLFRAVISPVPTDESETQLAIYKDQLSEIERDEARGTLTADEAKRLRTEVSRRILAADDAQKIAPKSMSATEVAVVVAIVVITLLGGGLWTYLKFGQPGYEDHERSKLLTRAKEKYEERLSQIDYWESLPPEILNNGNGRIEYLIMELRSKVPLTSDDIVGLEFLSTYEKELGNFRAAVAAKERVLEVKGGGAQAKDFFEYAELLILSSEFYVSPEAEKNLLAAMTRNPDKKTKEGALFFLGWMMIQNDRPDKGFDLWEPLLRNGDPEAPWQTFIRENIEQAAFLAGEHKFELPPLRLKGPSAEDIEAASEMTAEDREEFIRSMVAQLSDRLATEGGSAAEWARLISSYGILGEVENAKIIWTEAQAVFGSDQGAMAQLRAAAKSAGAIE